MAAAVGLVCLGGVTAALPYLMAPSLAPAGLMAFTMTGTVICGHCAFFKRYGPLMISEDRLTGAKQALRR